LKLEEQNVLTEEKNNALWLSNMAFAKDRWKDSSCEPIVAAP
jgi:hypothetical protein